MSEETKWVVVGVGRYHEDGFELVHSFDTEDEADHFLESDLPDQHADREWRTYYAEEVPHSVDTEGDS